jgi:hypothetical protein
MESIRRTAASYSMQMGNCEDEINDCRSLFLADIQELGRGSLKLVVAEGLPVGGPESITVGGVTISNCTRIEPTDRSRIFELVWTHYVGYAVLNESYASVNDVEQYEGSRFRVYSKSCFLDYMSRATFACDEHPGPTRHYCIACEDHIVEVLSVDPPTVTRVQ